MHWSSLFVAFTGLTAVAAQSKFRPGYPPEDPEILARANAQRIKIDADTACAVSEDKAKPRNIQLAAWVECQILAFYPYPRSADPNNTDWVAGYSQTFHPTLRASFNSTRYDYDGFLATYKTFSKIIGQNFEEYQPWRDYYVASPDQYDSKSLGGTVIGTGFNGGKLKSGVTTHAPNAGYFVIEEIEGRRWITELRELSTLASAYQLPKEGTKWKCNSAYEIC